MTGRHATRDTLAATLAAYQPYAEVNIRDDHGRPMTCKVYRSCSTGPGPQDPDGGEVEKYNTATAGGNKTECNKKEGQFLHVVNDEQIPPFHHLGRPMSTYEITLRVNTYFRTGREGAFEEPVSSLQDEARRDSAAGGYALFV